MISCRRARSLLVEHLRGAAGEAALFQLDQHLAACAKCRRERARMETAGALRTWQPPALSDTARTRIAKKLLAARPSPAAPRRAVARPLALLAGAFALAAIAALAWRARSKPPVAVAAQEGARRFDSAGTLGFLDAQLGYRAGT